MIKILQQIVYEFMVAYGQLLSSIVGMFVIAIMAILLAIAIPNLRKNHDIISWMIGITIISCAVIFNSVCIYLGQKAIKNERRQK